jgi:hypothetical protein
MPAQRVTIYTRASGGRREDSPEHQRGQVLPHCERNGYHVAGEHFDPGITADEFVVVHPPQQRTEGE